MSTELSTEFEILNVEKSAIEPNSNFCKYEPLLLPNMNDTGTRTSVHTKATIIYTLLKTSKNKQYLYPSLPAYKMDKEQAVVEEEDIIDATVIAIKNDKVIVEMYLEAHEIQKELDEYYVSILKENHLYYVGADFCIKHKKIKNGVQISIEPRVMTADPTLMELSRLWLIKTGKTTC